MSHPSRTAWLTILGIAAMGAPAPAANLNSALWTRFPKICAQLQKQGWGVPADMKALDKDAKAEMSVPGLLYLCNLGRALPGKGPGRAPDLQLLLSSGADDPSIVLSASWWCAADRTAALEALTQEAEKLLGTAKIRVPQEVLAAIRGATKIVGKEAEGLQYSLTPVEVDAGACDKVGPGKLGAVLMKTDLAIEPGP